MRTLSWCAVLAVALTSVVTHARPYRAMVTRTTETTGAGNIEIGLRYQGFLFGTGRRNAYSAVPFHQLAGHARVAITDSLELDTQVEVLLRRASADRIDASLGD